jgi:hypothetical protein
MQASQAFIAMLVLVASSFAPALSTPLECVAVPLILPISAELFIALASCATQISVKSVVGVCHNYAKKDLDSAVMTTQAEIKIGYGLIAVVILGR